MAEIWRDIPGWEGAYQASTLGRIRSLDRLVAVGTSLRRMPGKVLKSHPSNKVGHLQVSLGAAGGHRVHRLVAAAFLGTCPDGNLVRHLNGDPTDNRPENLAYGTYRENMLDAFEHGYRVRRPARQAMRCVRGHLKTSENLYQRPGGHIECRACRREVKRRWKENRKVES